MAPSFFHPLVIGAKNPISLSLRRALNQHGLLFKSLSLKSAEITSPVVVPKPIYILIPSLNSLEEIQQAQGWLEQAELNDIPVMLISSMAVLKRQDDTLLDESADEFCDGKRLTSLRRLEKQVLTHSKSMVLRVAQLASLRKSNNVLTELLHRTQDSKKLALNDSLLLSPSPTNQVADVIVAMLKQASCVDEVWGLYHFGGAKETSLYGLGKHFFDELKMHGLLNKLELLPTQDADPWLLKHALPPANSSKLFDTFGIRPKPWRDGISHIVRFHYGNDE